MTDRAIPLPSNRRKNLAIGGLAIAAAAAVIPVRNHFESQVRLSDAEIAMKAALCTQDRLCDGAQMMVAMRKDGELSLASTVGSSLKKLGNESGVADTQIMDLMVQLDKNLVTTKNYPSVVETDAMAIIRPPQVKANPNAPFSLKNPYLKAEFDMVVLTKNGKDCVAHTIRPDGTVARIEDLVRRASSHGGISSEECAEKRQRFMAKMSGPQV
jgi:hypothetical protein